MRRPSPSSLCLVRVVVAAGLAVAPLAAQAEAPSTDPLRVLRAMEVDGDTPFPRDRLACRLAIDQAVLRALQRALDAEAADVVADCVLDLHRRAGYADAVATGAVVEGVLRVALKTGAMCRQGPVRCSGNTVVDAASLRERLADHDGREVWKEGEAFASDSKLSERAVAVVRDAYAAIGRHGVRVDATTVRDGDTFVLQLAIADEGREVRVQSLRLDGEVPEHAAAVLAELAVEPGALATKEWLAKLQRRVETTGRYFTARAEVPAAPPAVLDPLVVAVQVRPGAPEPGKVPLRDAEQLQRAIDAVLERLGDGEPLRWIAEVTEEHSVRGLAVLPGSLRIAFARSGFAYSAERMRWGNADARAVAVRMLGDQLAVKVADAIGALRFGTAMGAQLQVASVFDASGEANLRWGIAFAVRAHDEFLRLDVHAGIAAHLLSKVTEVRRDGDELRLRFGANEVRIGADGSIPGDRLDLRIDGTPVRVELGGESLATEPPTAVTAGGGKAVVGVALADEFAPLLSAVLLPQSMQNEAGVRSLVDAAREQLVDWLRTPAAASSAKPEIPPPAEPTMQTMLLAYASLPGVHRSFSGRVVDVSSLLYALARGDVARGNAGLRALIADRETGPVWLGTLSAVFSLLGNEKPAAAMRALANERWSFDAAYADVADLLQNLPSLQPLVARIGAQWRQLPELREHAANLPAGETGDLAAWRVGLELLWDAGGGAALRKVLLDD